MDILFDKDYLKELYVTGKTRDRKHRYQPQIINKYVRVIDIIEFTRHIVFDEDKLIELREIKRR